jgi:hypothetical protein
MSGFSDAIRAALRPSPRLSVAEWLKEHVRFEVGPILGPLDVENSPWLKEPLEQLKNHQTREIICACSVQSAKTVFAEAAMLYLIAEEGGDMCLYLQTDEHSDEFLDTRFKRRILDCKPVRNLLVRGERSIQKRTVSFAHMTQFVLGATNIHNLQSKAARYVFGDEAAYWPNGHIGESRKRTTSFDGRNSKRVYIGTPLNNSGEYFDAFQDGTRSEWNVMCPACNEAFAPRLANLKWDGEKARLEDGKYDLAKIRESTRLECPNCREQLKDEPRLRRALAGSGFYAAENPHPDPSVKSYHWNSLTVPWVAWHTVVAEFLKAEHARKLGDYTPLAEFVRKRLGEFWDMRQFQSEEINLSGDFQMLTEWDQEVKRYMTVDVGRDYFRVIVRLWAQSGASRLFFAGDFKTWEQIRDFQEQHKITPKRVFVDCGFNTNEVLRQCAKYGWMAMKGDKTRFFTWWRTDRRTGERTSVQRPYSPPRKVDTSIGMHTKDKARMVREKGREGVMAEMMLFSSDYVKLVLHQLRAGRGASWEIAGDAPKFYHEEIANEVLVTEKDKKSGRDKQYFKRLGPNHSWDCCAMQVLGACMEKLIGEAEIISEKPLDSLDRDAQD